MGFLDTFRPPPKPVDEDQRLESLRKLGLVDSAPDANYDMIAKLTQDIFDVPVALISMVEAEHQWFKSCFGLKEKETPRDVAFCAHAILQNEVLVVHDAQTDERFKHHPLVTGYPYIRFYAGTQLRSPENHKIGTLCIVDYQPRQSFTKRDAQILRDLGNLISTLLIAKRLNAPEAEKKHA